MKKKYLASFLLMLSFFVCGAYGPFILRVPAEDIDNELNAGPARPNILMIVVDTLRADHLSSYGYKRPTTPNIDNLVRHGILFKSAYAQSNWTLFSFASFLTGKYPRSLGMLEADKALSKFAYIDPKLGEAEITLSEVLKKASYRTASFFIGDFNDSQYGFDQGFDQVFNRLYLYSKRHIRNLYDLMPEAFEWMGEDKNIPFFVILHSQEPHVPYSSGAIYLKRYVRDYSGIMSSARLSKSILAGIKKDDGGWYLSLDGLPEGGLPAGVELSKEDKYFSAKKLFLRLSQVDIDYLIARYDASVTCMDNSIGVMIEWLKKTAILDNTIIIIIGDHGEGLGDHGLFLHCTNPPLLYQEVIHVPFIIKIPKRWLKVKNSVINQPVELVDLMPTILDLAGVPGPDAREMDGKSLAGIITGTEEQDLNRLVFSETMGYGINVRSVIEGKWKLIRSAPVDGGPAQEELYDLRRDPGENRDLAQKKLDIVNRLKKYMNI